MTLAFPRVSGRPVRIGVTEKNRGTYWDMVNAGFHDAASHLGLEVDIRAPEFEDIDAQLGMIRAQLEAGVDALAIVAPNPDAFSGIVAEAAARGVPTAAFDLDAPASGRLFFFGMPTPHQMGRQVGEIMLRHIGGRGKVGVQTGSDRAQGARGKLAGFLGVMKENGIEVVGGENDKENVAVAFANARKLLAEHPDLDGIFGVYAYHSVVQAKAVGQLATGRKPVVVGFDMLPETAANLEAGIVRSSIWIREYYFGYFTAAGLSNVCRLGAASALELMNMDTQDLARNRREVPVVEYTPDTIGAFNAWAGENDILARTSRLTLDVA